MKYFIFSILIFCVACKVDSNKVEVESPETVELSQKPTSQAIETIKSSTLNNDIWEVEIVLDNGQIDKNSKWKGSLVDFKEDGTYTWYGDNFSNKGKYTLDESKNIVLLESNEPELSSEWSIKHRKSMMVWIGTPKFGHHAVQIKLIKQRSIIAN